MKRHVLLLLALLLSITLLPAQESDICVYEQRAQNILKQFGEESEEYLSALDSIITKASNLNHLDIALQYRHKHLDIVARIKGDDSNEYAEDCARLSNSYYRQKDFNNSLYYGLKAIHIFEIHHTINEYYQVGLGNISDCYRKLERYAQALEYQEKYVNITKTIDGATSNYYLWANVIAAHLAGMVDHWDKVELYSRNVLDVISINEDNFYIYENAQLCMHTYLWRNEQYQEATDLAIEFSENTKKFKGEISLEYAKSLSQIAGNYFVMDKVDSCVQYSLDAIKIYESYFAGDKDSLYKQEGYLNECNRLANVYSLVGRDFESFNYRKIICDVLKYNNKTETEEYYTSIQSLFMASAELGDYQFTLSIADSYYDMINKFSKNANEDLLVFYSNMSNIHINSNPQQAIYYMEKMIDILPLLRSGEKLNYELFDLYIAISSSSNEVQQQQMYFNISSI